MASILNREAAEKAFAAATANRPVGKPVPPQSFFAAAVKSSVKGAK